MKSRSNKRKRGVSRPLPTQRLQKKPKVNGTAKPTIDDLPNELLLNIIERFRTYSNDDGPWASWGNQPERFKTLVSLSLVNKRLHTLVEPFIYEIPHRLAQPFLFLRTMMTSPRLGLHVRELFFFTRGSDKARKYTLSAEDKRVVQNGLRALELPNWRKWAAECSKGHQGEGKNNHDAIYTASMLYTPNISYLQVVDHDSFKNPVWLRVLTEAVRPAPNGRIHKFEHLRTIVFSGEDRNLADYLPLFALPSLERLQLSGANQLEVPRLNKHPWSKLIRTSSIRRLNLYNSCIHTDALIKLIETCNTLREFHYVPDRYPDIIMRHVTAGPSLSLQYEKLSRALSRHCDTLQCIQLSQGNAVDWTHESAPKHQMVSLADMPHLKKLHIPLRSLVKIDSSGTFVEEAVSKLPPSLETLAFCEYCPTGESSESTLKYLMEKILSVKEQKLPGLKSIRIDQDWVENEWKDLTRIIALRKKFCYLGVVLDTYTDYDEGSEWSDDIDDDDDINDDDDIDDDDDDDDDDSILNEDHFSGVNLGAALISKTQGHHLMARMDIQSQVNRNITERLHERLSTQNIERIMGIEDEQERSRALHDLAQLNISADEMGLDASLLRFRAGIFGAVAEHFGGQLQAQPSSESEDDDGIDEDFTIHFSKVRFGAGSNFHS